MKKYNLDDIEPTVLKEAAVAYQRSSSGGALSLIHSARRGLSLAYLCHISSMMGLELADLAKILHVSLRTLQRYPDDKHLDTDASSKGLQLIHLYKKGSTVFIDQQDFAKWLRCNVSALDGGTPLSYLDTPFGFELVEQILGRIEHGIFS